MTVTLVAGYDIARIRKWKKGREQYGPTFVGDPVLEFYDEMVDSGMDTSGVESAMAILKKMSRERGKSIFLVSHKDELAGRVNNVLTVTKENGFTTYGTDIEIKE